MKVIPDFRLDSDHGWSMLIGKHTETRTHK